MFHAVALSFAACQMLWPRRLIRKTSVLALVATAAFASLLNTPSAIAKTSRQPNVVVILTDDKDCDPPQTLRFYLKWQETLVITKTL